MRSERDLESVIEMYADTVKRICVVYLKNKDDTEDIFQTVFLKYWKSSAHFESEEHRKAFIIRVTINQCKDFLKSFFRKNTVSIDLAEDIKTEDKSDDKMAVRKAVINLPEKYKAPIYLHYFEGYSAVEIAKILDKNANTIYTLLSRGREMLKNVLGGIDDE